MPDAPVTPTPRALRSRLNQHPFPSLRQAVAVRSSSAGPFALVDAAARQGADIVAGSVAEADHLRGLMPLGVDVRVVPVEGVNDLVGREGRPLLLAPESAMAIMGALYALAEEAALSWAEESARSAEVEQGLRTEIRYLKQVRHVLERRLLSADIPFHGTELEQAVAALSPEPAPVVTPPPAPDPWTNAMATRDQVAADGDLYETFRCLLYERVLGRVPDLDTYEEWRFADPAEVGWAANEALRQWTPKRRDA